MGVGAGVEVGRRLHHRVGASVAPRRFDHSAAFLRRLDGEPVIGGRVAGALARTGLRAAAAVDDAGGHQEREAELTGAVGALDETVEQALAKANRGHRGAPAVAKEGGL
jgi:hypothetical protein